MVALSANDSPADKAFRNERRHLTAEDLRLRYATLRNMRALANANWEALVPLAVLIPATPEQLAAARYRAFRLPTNRRDEVSVDGSLLGVTEPAPGRVLVGIRTIEPLAIGRSCRAVAEALRVRIQLPALDGGLRTLGDGLEEVTVIGSAEGSYVRRLSGNRFVSGRGNRIVDEVPNDDLCDRILLHLGRHRGREKQRARGSLGQDDGGGEGGVHREHGREAWRDRGTPFATEANARGADGRPAGARRDSGDGVGQDATDEAPPARVTDDAKDPPERVERMSGLFPGPGERLLTDPGNDPHEVDLWRRFAPFAPALMRWMGSDLEAVGRARIAWERPRPVRVVTSPQADRPALVLELIDYLYDVVRGQRSSRRMAELLDRAESVLIEIGEVTGTASPEIQDAIREARAEVSRGHLDGAARIAASTAKMVRRRVRP